LEAEATPLAERADVQKGVGVLGVRGLTPAVFPLVAGAEVVEYRRRPR
jgi:hypothetical protein